MGKLSFLDNVREWIGGKAWDVFLWAVRMTEEEYFDAIMASYPKHCEHGYNGLCPTCDAMQTPPKDQMKG
jgi:hypothetical protein